jgi:hypothetical protein
VPDELGLGVDLRQRLDVFLAPLAEQQALRPELARDH